MDKIEREKVFHNKIFEDKTRKQVNKFYSITKASRSYYHDLLVENGAGKKVLEYGCGPGSSAFVLVKSNAEVTGIDISEYAISLAKSTAATQQMPVVFRVMNAEELSFEDHSFDLICGSGIIHHLQLEKAFSELSRTLTSDGKAIFLEPLGHNPLINFYRKLTPNLRTEDEHPLLISDLEIARRYFRRVEPVFFHLLSLLAVPLRCASFFNPILGFLDSMDRMLFTFFPFTKRYAWSITLSLAEPIKKN